MNTTGAATVTNGAAGIAMSSAYGLLDAESANLLGTNPTELAALLVVAGIAHRYGQESSAVAALVLYRNDVSEADSVIAEGEELVRRALTAAGVSQKA